MPVSLAEGKAHLRVDHSDDDADIQLKLDAATQQIDGPQGELGVALTPQSWAWTIDHAFPSCGVIRLPICPILSIDAVVYVDAAGAEQTLATDAYDADLERGEITAAYGGTFPSARCQRNAVRVELTAGYADAARVPADLKAAILLRLGQLYENREPTKVEESAMDALKARHRRWWTEA